MRRRFLAAMVLARCASSLRLVWRATPLSSLSVSGGDAASFLHAILSGDVASLGERAHAESCLLTGRSAVVDLVTVARDGDGFVLLCEDRGRVLAELEKRVVAEDVRISDHEGVVFDVTEEPGPFEEGSRSPGESLELLARRALAGGPGSARRMENVWMLGGTSLGGAGARVAVLGGSHDGDRGAWEARRVRAGRPRVGFEFGEGLPDRNPLELGLGFACDASKGCYLGAELVNKMRKAGSPRSRLRSVALDPAPRRGAWPAVDATSLDAAGGFALATVPRARKLRVGDAVAVGDATGTLLRAPFGGDGGGDDDRGGRAAAPDDARGWDAVAADLAALEAAAATPYARELLGREAARAAAKRDALGADDGDARDRERRRKADKLAAMAAKMAAFQGGAGAAEAAEEDAAEDAAGAAEAAADAAEAERKAAKLAAMRAKLAAFQED